MSNPQESNYRTETSQALAEKPSLIAETQIDPPIPTDGSSVATADSPVVFDLSLEDFSMPSVTSEQVFSWKVSLWKFWQIAKIWLGRCLHLIPLLVTIALLYSCNWYYHQTIDSEFFFYDIDLGTCLSIITLIVSFLVVILIALIRMKKFPPSVGAALLVSAPFVSFIGVQSVNAINIFSYSPKIFWVNIIIYAAVYLLLYGITSNFRITLILGSLIFLAFSLADYYVDLFRGTPFLPSDLFAAGTAMDVIDGYTFTVTAAIVLHVILCLMMIWAAFTVREVKIPYFKLKSLLPRLGAAVVSLGFLVSMGTTELFNNLEIWNDPWEMESSRANNGSLLNFCLNIQFMVVDKPSGYSPEKVNEIVEQLEVPAQPTLSGGVTAKNVIVIMNESLADLDVIAPQNLTEDPLPFIHSLSENTIKGNCYVSIFGGGTCNSEYEALTGNSQAFLPVGSIAFQQYVKEPTTSLGSLFGSLGFDTYALHPYLASAWQRDRVYPLLGFDDFLVFDDYQACQPTNMLRNLVSDQSNFDQLIYNYEHKEPGSDLMMFNVTIQNHGGYADSTYPTTIQVADNPGAYPNTEQYLSLLKDTDTAFQNLIEYFSAQEEPTVILMFGDHQPKIEDAYYESLFGKSLEELDQEETERRYQTPYLLWANYDIPELEMDLSSNYLSTLVMDAAGVTLPDYNRFLKQMAQEIPVFNRYGYIDKNGVLHELDEENEYSDLINDYQILQYNNMFDLENRVDSVFEMPAS